MDTGRLIAAAALAEIATTQARDAQAEQKRRHREAAGRLDDRVIGWTIRLVVVGVIGAVVLGLWAWHDAPSAGQLALHVWWALVITALSVVIVGALAILVRWPWDGRGPRVAVAIMAAVLAAIGIAFATPHLRYHNVMGTGFDFASEYYTCGDAVRIPIRPDDSDAELWQMFRARVKGSEVSGCNRVVLYRGKERISSFDLTAPQLFLPTTAPDGGAAMFAALNGKPLPNSDIVEAPLDEVTFYARGDAGTVVSVSPGSPDYWRS